MSRIENPELIRELQLSHDQGSPTQQLAIYLQQISTGLSDNHRYRGYSVKDDLASIGTMHLLQVWRGFKLDHPAANPFGYFTRAAESAFLKFLDKEKIQWFLVEEDLRDAGMLDDIKPTLVTAPRQQHWQQHAKSIRAKYQAKQRDKPEVKDDDQRRRRTVSPAALVIECERNEPEADAITRGYQQADDLNITPITLILRYRSHQVEHPFHRAGPDK